MKLTAHNPALLCIRYIFVPYQHQTETQQHDRYLAVEYPRDALFECTVCFIFYCIFSFGKIIIKKKKRVGGWVDSQKQGLNEPPLRQNK